MPSLTEWKVPPAYQPRPGDYSFDLDRVLSSVVGLHSIIPADAFSAETLGTERAGNGVADRRRAGADHRLSDHRGRIGLAASRRRPRRRRPCARLRFRERLRPGAGARPYRSRSAAAWLFGRDAQIGDRVVVGGAGGRTRSVASQIAAKQEFAGYWEYLLDEAIFTYPAHPNWGGTGLISTRGELIGIGSLQLERERDGKGEHVNMIVPIDLLEAGARRSAQVRPRQQACAALARNVSRPRSTTRSW